MRSFFTGIAASIALFCCSGFASAQVDALRIAVDSIFAEYGHDDGPGCAVAVSSEGRIRLLRGYGFASLEHSVPIAPETVFDVVYLPSHQDLADLLNLLRRIKGAV